MTEMNCMKIEARSPRGLVPRLMALMCVALVWLCLLDPGRAQAQLDDAPPPPPPGFASGAASPVVFTARDGREMLLRVPSAWDANGGPGPQGSITVDLAPRAGRAFSLQLTAIPLTPSDVGRLQADGLRQLVQTEGERMLAEASETSIRLESVMGAFGRGYVYSITDRRAALPRGEWRYMTAGSYLVGDTLIQISLLSNEGVGAIRMQALDVLRSAQVQAAF
jgi:hypothetical protein